MSFIYCHEGRGSRWYYRQDEGGSAFTRDRESAYHFATKEAAWEHCRRRRKSEHWRGCGGRWIVITLPKDLQSKGVAQEKP